jgi:hypothetical protein
VLHAAAEIAAAARRSRIGAGLEGRVEKRPGGPGRCAGLTSLSS